MGLNLGYNGNQLDVLVSSGTTVYAYNATTGAAAGSFTTSEPVDGIASNETITVLESNATNQLQMINLTRACKPGWRSRRRGTPPRSRPRRASRFWGALTSTPGSTTVSATVGAHFDSFQPTQFQLGLQSVDAVEVNHSKLSYKFSAGTPAALTQNGAYATVQTAPPIPTQPGAALGSIDQSLALVAGAPTEQIDPDLVRLAHARLP